MEPENNENELVFEMITFSKKNHKSLPANLCISTSEFGFDDPKIKIQQDTDEEIHMEHAFFMTVPEKEIIGDPGTLDNEMLDYFRAFMSAVQKVTTPWPKTRILSICNSLTY